VIADRRVDCPGVGAHEGAHVLVAVLAKEIQTPTQTSPITAPEVELVSVEEAHHKSHDHNYDRGNSNSLPFLALV
jgi:hypothetical protein